MNWIKKHNIFNEHHAQLPVVDVLDSVYRIYYSTRIGGRSTPMWIDVDQQSFQVVNKCTNPILPLGAIGTFDHYGVMPTDIVDVNDNTKYLYYIGWSLRQDVPYHNTLGLAISYDAGSTWYKHSTGPVFSSCTKEPGFIGTAKVFNNGGDWSMYYLSCRDWFESEQGLEPMYDIKLAKSSDGVSWIPLDKIIVPLLEGEGGISSFQMIKDKAWFSVRGAASYRNDVENSYKIKTSTLTDGEWIRDAHTELDVSVDGWDSEMVAYPYIVQNSNELIMFYNGNGFGKTGIGYAIAGA